MGPNLPVKGPSLSLSQRSQALLRQVRGTTRVDPRERSKIYNGASVAFSRAVEMVVTPLIFGFLGYRLDLWVGTTPAFTVVLSVFCLGYITWKTCVGYSADMVRQEAELRGRRSGPSAARSAPSVSAPPLIAHE